MAMCTTSGANKTDHSIGRFNSHFDEDEVEKIQYQDLQKSDEILPKPAYLNSGSKDWVSWSLT